MRIEKVIIENINSLFGRFEIDFTEGGYNEGLFAIVGPSGAGKSTVLDAICLALYGETPRIGSISKLTNEIMNKNASRCSAEVVFWSRGKRYKASFSQQRAKGKDPFGAPKREIVEFNKEGIGIVIASAIKESCQKIVEVTGLDYSQFTRSIMLAQFQFAEFLKADSNDRADILEQISDMNIYRRISAATYERKKKEDNTLETIRLQQGAVKVLDDEEVVQLENEQRMLTERIKTHTALQVQFVQCKELQSAIATLNKQLDEYTQKKTVATQQLVTAQKRFDTAKADEDNKRRTQAGLNQTLRSVRELDYKIGAANEEIKRLSAEIKDLDSKIIENKRSILNIFKKYMPDAIDEKLKQTYESDAPASIIRAEVDADLKNAEDKEKTLTKQMEQILQGKDDVYWQERIGLLETVLPIVQARREVVEAEIQRQELKTKYKAVKTTQEKLRAKEKEIQEKFLFAQLQQKFGEERERLIDGQPCPLCGATAHPAATQANDSRYLQEITAQRDTLQKQTVQTQNDLAGLQHGITGLEKTIAQQEKIAKEHKSALSEQGWKTEDAGVDPIDENAADRIRKYINDAKQMIQKYGQLRGQMDAVRADVLKYTQQLGDVDKDVSRIEHCKQIIGETERQVEEKKKQLAQVNGQHGELNTERKKLFGDKNADAEEKKADELVKQAERATEQERNVLEQAKTLVANNENDIARTKKDIITKQERLNAEYFKAVAEVNVVFAAHESFDNSTLEIAQGIRKTANLLGETAVQSRDAIREIADKLGTLISRQTERKGEVKTMLSTNAQNKAMLRELRREEKKQAAECEKWNRLNALIGSADGIKFSRMAQGITFEVLLKYANQSLAKMSDRYVLIRDERNASKPLEISVVDNYQAGDIRPVSNLSGGESFVVSLALALGLSEMSSSRTRIDSLFIDEGFASLDDAYLESALQTLSSLGNREGKLVGVISHVGALKERIDTQIEVTKLSGGRSTLSGPGVTATGG